MLTNPEPAIEKDGAETAPNHLFKPYLFLVAGVIAAITFLSFFPVLKNGFVNQDDNIYIFENASLAKPLPNAIARFFGPHYFTGNYVPVTMIVYSIVYHLAGAAPGSYHLASLLIHIGNVVLVFWFIYLLSGRNPLVAAFVALLFGIHPMHVESVGWAAELRDVLYTFFFMAGLVAYYMYIERVRVKTSTPGKNLKFLIITFLLFVISILSKPSAIIFPVILLLLDFYTRRKFAKQVWLEKLPFFVVSLILAVITFKAQQAEDFISYQYSYIHRLLFAVYAIVIYIVKFFLPVHQSFFYPYPQPVNGHLPYMYYAAPVLAVILLYGVYRTLRYTRVVAFGFLFFIINLFLVLKFVIVGNALLADRYTYIPYIGLLFIVGVGLNKIYQNAKLRAYKAFAIIIVVILSISCFFLTYARCKVWKNEHALVTNVLDNFPDNPIALNDKGYLLFEAGTYRDAIPLFKKAIHNRPAYVKSDYIKPYINLKDCYLALKENDSALSVLNDGLKYAPHDFALLINKADLLFMQQQYAVAINYFKQAINENANAGNSQEYIKLSQCYYELKDYDSWGKTIDTALKYEPDNYELLNIKGSSLAVHGNYPGAISYYKAALKINPAYTLAIQDIVNCYMALNENDTAMSVLDDALGSDPHNFHLLNGKGLLLLAQQKYAEAAKYFNEAIINANEYNPNEYLNLSQCYYELKDYIDWGKTLDAALRYDPDNYVLLNNKGYSLFLQGSYSAAMAYYKASLKINPGFTMASQNIANCIKAMNSR